MKGLESNKKRGIRLRECRKEKGITQEQLSERAHFSKQHISYIECGARGMSYDAAVVFSDILKVRKEYLLCEDDYKTSHQESEQFLNTFEADSKLAIDILNLFGIKILARVIITADGNKFVSTDNNHKIFVPENLVINNDIEINGTQQTVQSIKIRIEVNGIQKELSTDTLYYMITDVMDYANFKCKIFKQHYFRL